MSWWTREECKTQSSARYDTCLGNVKHRKSEVQYFARYMASMVQAISTFILIAVASSKTSEHYPTQPKELRKKDFLMSFGLRPTHGRLYSREIESVFHSQTSCPLSPHTPRLISQLSREFSPHRYRYEHGHVVSLQEDPETEEVNSPLEVDFSSPLGLQLHDVMEKLTPKFSYCGPEALIEYCHTPEKSDMVRKLRHQGQFSYPVTYRKSRKSAYRECHMYKFNKQQNKEWWITIHTGMDHKTRALRARLPACHIRLLDMSESDIEVAKDRVRAEHQRMLREQEERMKRMWSNFAQRPIAPPIYPVHMRQNYFFYLSGINISALTPPTTPPHGVYEADPIVIDDDDDVVCVSDSRPGPKPDPVRQDSQSLLFKCHLCGAELSCRGDFGQSVEAHYVLAHQLNNIRLVRHQDASGNIVVSIVEKDPKPSSKSHLNQPTPPRTRFVPKNQENLQSILKNNVGNRIPTEKASKTKPDVICID